MTIEQKTAQITRLATALISDQPELFLVDVKLKPGNKIQVLLDADAGLPLSTCVACNRTLYKQVEEAGLFPPGEFELEVSSPGLDEPLKLPRQYSKNIGRQVEVLLKDGRKITGKLLTTGDAVIGVEETRGKGKKQEIVSHTIQTDHIKTTKIQIVF
ncbi:MAG TPA: ribosome maturation factor [Lacibacter sp.]|nr:ribosome maturation factor [Lacibacter sp.]HMO90510.1 ribosome maturation factor [Lacibacter sp.]HMP87521.1 ribosome maturation factor [Lacibacter sp.]